MSFAVQAVAPFRAVPGGSWARWLAPAWRAARAEEEALDRATGLYTRSALIDAVQARQARGEQVSLVVVEIADFREVRQIYGSEVFRGVLARVVSRLRRLAGWRGIAARTGASQFTVALPCDAERATRQLQRVLGLPARVEFDAGESEIVLVPEVLVHSPAPGQGIAQELERAAVVLRERQQEERRRRHFLARERQRHSRPMTMPPRY